MDAPPVQYVTTSDGYSIAYTVAGQGPTLVYMPFSFNHLGLFPPVHWGQGPLLRRLSQHFRLVRYDARGQGLSTRSLGEHHSLQAYERDLEAIVDHLQLEQVVVMGGDLSSHIAVRYAVRHPGRVRALVLWRTGVTLRRPATFTQGLAASDWDLFVSSLLGSVQANEMIGPEERRAAVIDMKQSVTQADWLKYARVAADSSLQDELPRLHTPTLVLDEGGSLTISQDDAARLAALIGSARLALVDKSGGLGILVQPVLDFLATLPGPQAAHLPPDGLSARQVEVLRLIAAGKSNQQIAAELVITLNTVQHHVSNILTKTGLASRGEAAAYAHRNGLV